MTWNQLLGVTGLHPMIGSEQNPYIGATFFSEPIIGFCSEPIIGCNKVTPNNWFQIKKHFLQLATYSALSL
jgi:hypothetical protein